MLIKMKTTQKQIMQTQKQQRPRVKIIKWKNTNKCTICTRTLLNTIKQHRKLT